ncbi:MAG TPA: M56 family metallopeptidase [Pyrinomonadaceae bacterium]|nr:M56 family metallopeptidase [Pyrinomonadaceae bacterium]
MYELIGICLALASLLALNACALIFAAAIWRVAASRTSGRHAAARERLLFTLRALPPALATLFVFALVVPAYILNEPTHTDETVGVKLLFLAAASAAGVFLALKRVSATWWATRRLARGWMRQAEPVAIRGVTIPAYRIRHYFPVIAVVGVLRPRLFLAAQVFDALADDELAAALAHERRHVEARDNLKRALLQAGQDALLFVPVGRALVRAWQQESELAADEFAASQGATYALNLASAIIKISRLIPAGARPSLPGGAHLLGAEEDGLSRRVLNLLRLAAPDSSAGAAENSTARTLPATALRLSLCAAFLFVITRPDVLKITYSAIEQVVARLR